MAVEKHKMLQAAERLLKQGKVQAALSELQRVSQGAPNDLLTLNRLADLLARQGRNAEAISYYNRIATQFAEGGFYPKAIAIHKKSLRLEPNNIESLVQLGELYLAQKLTGEARSYFLAAADYYLKQRRFDRASEIYGRLVRADPTDPRHRVRLAEALAADGSSERAADEFLAVAGALLEKGASEEAERIYRRAAELAPGRNAARLGLARALDAQGRGEASLTLLRDGVAGEGTDSTLQAELLRRAAAEGRQSEMIALLSVPRAVDFDLEILKAAFAAAIRHGFSDELWRGFDVAVEATATRRDRQPVAVVLEALAELENGGHVPALQRLRDLQRDRADRDGLVRSLEWLAAAQNAKGMSAEAERTLAELAQLRPESPLVQQNGNASVARAANRGPSEFLAPYNGDPRTPAVPLSRADSDFVSGRLTQSEILEKYSLHDQALEQLREVVTRFPGRADVLERVVFLSRAGGSAAAVAQALGRLAIALRASGDDAGALQAATEAASSGQLDPADLRLLEQLALVPIDLPPQQSGPIVEAPRVLSDPATPTHDADPELVIDFADSPPPDAESTGVASGSADSPQKNVGRARPTRPPSQDMVDEIDGLLVDGRFQAAAAGIASLRSLGYESEELSQLSLRATRGPSDAGGPGPSDVEDVVPDLDLFAAALESELVVEDLPDVAPVVAEDESLEEILESFKSRVHEQVDAGDYRTHYDLGIAYKEMGLIDDAIREFESVTGHPGLFREACNMLALCHRERAEHALAIRWYRRALDTPGGDPQVRLALSYDLADVLQQCGDEGAALDLFRDLANSAPRFRDVDRRLADLELARKL